MTPRRTPPPPHREFLDVIAQMLAEQLLKSLKKKEFPARVSGRAGNCDERR